MKAVIGPADRDVSLSIMHDLQSFLFSPCRVPVMLLQLLAVADNKQQGRVPAIEPSSGSSFGDHRVGALIGSALFPSVGRHPLVALVCHSLRPLSFCRAPSSGSACFQFILINVLVTEVAIQ